MKRMQSLSAHFSDSCNRIYWHYGFRERGHYIYDGENCKVNIARVILSVTLEVCPFADGFIVGVFALQLLNIMVYIMEIV